MATKKQSQAELKEELKDKRENSMDVLTDIYGQNSAIIAIFDKISKKLDVINNDVKNDYSELKDALESGNSNDISKSIDKLIRSIEKNKNGISNERQIKKAKFESKNPEASKNLNTAREIALKFSANDKSLKEVKKILDDIENAAISGSYSARQLMESLDSAKFDGIESASEQLNILRKTADNCGVSLATLGLKFNNTGKGFSVFNKEAEKGYENVVQLRQKFDKCSASTFAFGASIYAATTKIVDLYGKTKEIIDKTVEYRRNIQVLSVASSDMMPGGAKGLDNIRKEMNLTMAETVKFADTVKDLRGTTYSVNDLTKAMQGMRDTIGEVDIDKLSKLAGIMQSIPKVQLDAFTSGTGNETDVMNAIMNMQKSGKTQEVLELGASGAFGKNFAQASGTNISANDKSYLDNKRTVETIKETAQNKLTDSFGSFVKYMPHLAAITSLVGIGSGIFSQIKMLQGGVKALGDILNSEKRIDDNVDKIAQNSKKGISDDDKTTSINRGSKLKSKNKKTDSLKDKIDKNNISKINKEKNKSKNKNPKISLDNINKKSSGRNSNTRYLRILERNNEISNSIKESVDRNFDNTSSKLDSIIGGIDTLNSTANQILSAIPSGNSNNNSNNVDLTRRVGKNRSLSRSDRIKRVNAYRASKGKTPLKFKGSGLRVGKGTGLISKGSKLLGGTGSSIAGIGTKIVGQGTKALSSATKIATTSLKSISGATKALSLATKGISTGLKGVAAATGATGIGLPVAAALLAGDAAFAGVQGFVRTKEDNEQAKAIQESMGVAGGTNAYDMGAETALLNVLNPVAGLLMQGATLAYDAMTGGKVYTDPMLLVDSLEGFAKGAWENLSLGFWKESGTSKENRSVDIAARTQDKYTVSGFKEIYKMNKVLNKLEVNAQKRNIYSAQHFDATMKRLDAINQGQFAMLENMHTQIAIMKMQNGFFMGQNNADYRSQSNTVVSQSMAGFLKEQKELETLKSATLSDSNLTETQRSAELAKISESEMNIRMKLIDNLKKSLSMENIPSIIENAFKKVMNDSVIAVNSMGYGGSDRELLSATFKNIDIAFSDLTASVEFAGDSFKKMKKAQDDFKKSSQSKIDGLSNLGETAAKNGILSKNFATRAKSELKVGNDDHFDIKTIDMGIEGTLSKEQIDALQASGLADSENIKALRNGASLKDIKELDDSMTQAGKDNGFRKLVERYESQIREGDAKGADATISILRGLENAAKKGGYHTESMGKFLDELEQTHKTYGGKIGGKANAMKKEAFVTSSGADYNKLFGDLSTNDLNDLISKDEIFKKQLAAQGFLKEDGTIDENKKDDIRNAYIDRKSDVAKEGAFNYLEKNDELFKQAKDEWIKNNQGKDWDSNAKDEAYKLYQEKIMNQSQIAGLTSDQLKGTRSVTEYAANVTDEKSLKDLKDQTNILNKIFDEASKKTEDQEQKDTIDEGKKALDMLNKGVNSNGEKLSAQEIKDLTGKVDKANKVAQLSTSNVAGASLAARDLIDTINGSKNDQLKIVQMQAEVMKGLTDKYSKLINSLKSLEQVVSQSTQVRLAELKAGYAQTNLTLTEWSGGETGSASFDVLEKQRESTAASLKVLGEAREKLNGEFGERLQKLAQKGSEAISSMTSAMTSSVKELSIGDNMTVDSGLKKMGELAKKGSESKDDEEQNDIREQISNMKERMIEALNKKYKDPKTGDFKNAEAKKEYEANLGAIEQVAMQSNMVIGSGGTIEGIDINLAKQENEQRIKNIGFLKQQNDYLKKSKESLLIYAKAQEEYALEQRGALLKANLGSSKDIIKNMKQMISAVGVQFEESIRMQNSDVEAAEKNLSTAKANYSSNPNQQNKDKLLEAQSNYNAAVGKRDSLQAERMKKSAEVVSASLDAIAVKFTLAAEKIDILKDRAENVAGTTEEWFRLENERLSIMYQEVQAMKDVVNSAEFLTLSEEEQAKKRNDLARKQLNLDKERIGAQRSVFEKQLGAIVGGLQQSGAFRGMSKAAIFGVGHGENEAGMAVQHTNKNKFGYTDRLANANDLLFSDSLDNLPTGRMAGTGDIAGAANAHNQIDGKMPNVADRVLGRTDSTVVNPTKVNEEKVAKANQEITNEIQKVKNDAESGKITEKEKNEKLEKLNESKNKLNQSKEISKMSSDDVMKSMLTYVIDIDEILKNSLSSSSTSKGQTGSNETYDKNGKKTENKTKKNDIKSQNINNKNNIKKVKNDSLEKLYNNTNELKKREEHQIKINEDKSNLEKQLKRDDITQEDKEKIKEKLQAINIAENTADKSGKTNKERIAELKSKVEAGKQLATIYENESIARDTTGKYSEEEKMKAKQKVESTKSTMNKQASMEYIAKKDQNVLSMRNELSRLDPNSDKAKELQKQISQNEEDSLGVFSNLSGDDLKAAAVQKEVEYVERQKQIDQLKQGNSTERESAARLQKKLDEDISKTDAVLGKKGVNVGEIIDAGRKKEDLEAVNGQLSKTDARIAELQEKKSSGDTEKQARLEKIDEREKRLRSANELYEKSLNDKTIQWAPGLREKVEASLVKNSEELSNLRAEKTGLKLKRSLTPEEQEELDRLNRERASLQNQKAEIEGREDYGVFQQDESKKTSQPDSATVAQITKNNEDAKAKVENKQALEAIALGENKGKINKSGSDGQVVDMFGVNKTENTTSSGGGSSGSANMEIVLKLDNATLAREVVKIIAGNDNFRIMHSAGGQVSYRNTSNPN